MVSEGKVQIATLILSAEEVVGRSLDYIKNVNFSLSFPLCPRAGYSRSYSVVWREVRLKFDPIAPSPNLELSADGDMIFLEQNVDAP